MMYTIPCLISNICINSKKLSYWKGSVESSNNNQIYHSMNIIC